MWPANEQTTKSQSTINKRHPLEKAGVDTLHTKRARMTNSSPVTDANMKESTTATESNISNIISQGAEAVISVIDYVGGRKAVCKERIPKRYRFQQLDDKLRGRRVAQEARVISRLQKAGIRVPAIYEVDLKRTSIIMQYIDGISLKTYLQQKHNNEQSAVSGIMDQVGAAVAKMHNQDIVHGDLTSGNIMIDQNQAVLIDFGLSFSNATDEDFAVDLYVFERAIGTSHHSYQDELVSCFMSSYMSSLGSDRKRTAVQQKLEEVRSRGRKRDMIG